MATKTRIKRVKLVFGLGNPEAQYKNTRHNFGRDFVGDADLGRLQADFNGRKKTPIKQNVSKNEWGELNFSKYKKYKNLILACGKVFVNESGKAISELQRKFKLKPEEIMIIHDEADLPFLWLKLSFGKKAAGHKGVESIRKILKTWDFWRLRIGIQAKKRKPAMEIILKKLKEDEQKQFNKALKKFKEILDKISELTPDRLNFSQKMLTDI